MEVEMMFGLFISVMIGAPAICALWYAGRPGD